MDEKLNKPFVFPDDAFDDSDKKPKEIVIDETTVSKTNTSSKRDDDIEDGFTENIILLQNENVVREKAVSEINIDETPVPKKREKGVMHRNGKVFKKCKTNYIYYCDRGYFAYRLCYEDKDTKINTFVDKPYSTEKQAAKALQEHINEIRNDGTYKNRNITFGALWEKMQQSLVKAESTFKKYNSVYNHHVKYEFGNKKIKEITYTEVNNYLEKLYRMGDGHGNKQNGYSFAYVESILKFFWLVLNHAFSEKILSADELKLLTDNIKMPKNEEPKSIRILNSEQIQEIYKLLKDTDYLLPMLISLYSGARPAEAFAIRFSDIDYKKKTINIDKQIVEFDGKLTLKPPKTFARVVEIPDALIEEVKERERLIKDAKKKDPESFEINRQKVIYDFKGKNGLDDLFEDSVMLDTKGRYNAASGFQYYAKIIREKYCPNDYKKESFSFYTFRKTALSIFASQSMPIGALMKISGHLKSDTLYTYYYSDENEFAQKKIKESVIAMNGLIKK